MGIREYSDFLQKRSTSFEEHYKSMKQKIVIISQVQHLAEKEKDKFCNFKSRQPRLSEG